MKTHLHKWVECSEKIEAVYKLKANTGGIMGVHVQSPTYICTENCQAKAVRSPWTGLIVELEPK